MKEKRKRTENQKLENDMEKYSLYLNRKTISLRIWFYLFQVSLSLENSIITIKQITGKIQDLLRHFSKTINKPLHP